MDCPSEENMIRLKLKDNPDIKTLEFNIPERRLFVTHECKAYEVDKSIAELKLGSSLLETIEIEPAGPESIEMIEEENALQKKLLWTVLIINFSFFLIELIFGFLSSSMGLVADSLDMLADSFVYLISLFAVGAAISRKKTVAKVAGYFQLTLAALGFWEIIHRFLEQSQMPDFKIMIFVSFLAMAANAYCLYLLQKSRNKEDAHLKASLIFTSNDVIVNLGVIIAGLLVLWLDSYLPDLIIGTLVFGMVVQGSLKILSIGK